MRIPVTTLAIALAGAWGLFAAPLRAEPPARRAHPLYDDGGTLDWSTRLAEAREVAKKERRLILIEWGRVT